MRTWSNRRRLTTMGALYAALGLACLIGIAAGAAHGAEHWAILVAGVGFWCFSAAYLLMARRASSVDRTTKQKGAS